MVNVIHARNTEIKIGDALSSVSTDSTLDDQMTGTSITAYFKEVTITYPEMEVNKIDLLGKDSEGFQNVALEKKPAGLGSISGTLVYYDDEVFENYLAGNGEQVPSGTPTHTRYRIGVDENREPCAILIQLQGQKEKNILFNNFIITKLGDVKTTGADGHYEVEIKGVSLPKDVYVEFEN